MLKRMFHWVIVALAAMLSYSQAYAFESPSGYQDVIYTVDWSYYSEPIVGKAATPNSVSANIAENLTISNSLVMPYKSYTSGAYITYKYTGTVSLTPAKPQRGYIKVLFS